MYAGKKRMGLPLIFWILSVLFIVYGTLIPFNFNLSVASLLKNIHGISLTPFVDPDGSRASIPDIVQNILLFIPFGIFGFLTLHRRRSNAAVGMCVIILGSFLSLTVEAFQLATSDRTTSITDLITNTTGSAVGIIATWVFLGLLARVADLNAIKVYFNSKFSFAFVIAAVIVIAGTFQPFDFSLDVGQTGSKVRTLLNHPFEVSFMLKDEGTAFIRQFLFILAGVLWLKRIGRKNFHPLLITICTLFACFLELAQLIVSSRMPSFQDSIVIVAASVFAAIFAHPLARCPKWFLSAAMVTATALSAALLTLYPFEFTDQFSGMNLIPFLPYYQITSFVAFSNFIEAMFVFLPMGVVMAILGRREKTMIPMVFLLTLTIAIPLELLQGWVVGRFPDVTDILGGALGGILGVLIWTKGLQSYQEGIRG